jgi:hypothetical protein
VTQIAFALKAADRPEAVGALLQLVQNGKIPEANLTEALALAGSLGTPEDLTKLLDLASASQAAPGLVLAGYNALAVAASQRQLKPAGGADRILLRLDQADSNLRAAAARLAGSWKPPARRWKPRPRPVMAPR